MNTPNFEGLAELYASACAQRRGLTEAIRARLLDVYREHAPALREAISAQQGAADELLAAIEAHPGAFEKPRTRQAHGIKFGWAKGKDRIDIVDEAKTIKLIRQKLPIEQGELLIRVRESVHKPGLLDITSADLRRIGVRQIPGVDHAIVKAIDDGVDKLVDVMLADLEHVEGGA